MFGLDFIQNEMVGNISDVLYFFDLVVPWDWASPGGHQADHPGRKPGSAIPRHPDGRQGGEGAVRAHRGRVRERRKVS